MLLRDQFAQRSFKLINGEVAKNSHVLPEFREQPGIDLAALLPPGLAASLQALLSALGAAPPSGADPRQALAAHTHNFGSYFVPFVLGTLPNFLAKAGLLDAE